MPQQRNRVDQSSQGRLRDVFNSSGHRLTAQRECVLQLFQELGDGHHLTAEEVHDRLRKAGQSVALATVYRSLKLLVEIGLLEEVEWREGMRRYELRHNHGVEHHHLICMRCGVTEEFVSEVLNGAAADVARHRRFKLVEVRLTLHGLCRSCRERSDQSG